jgi:hypothetical protein
MRLFGFRDPEEVLEQELERARCLSGWSREIHREPSSKGGHGIPVLFEVYISARKNIMIGRAGVEGRGSLIPATYWFLTKNGGENILHAEVPGGDLEGLFQAVEKSTLGYETRTTLEAGRLECTLKFLPQ